MVRNIVATAIVVLVLTPVHGNAQTPEELFQSGNSAYANRQYDSAAACYEAVLKTGEESASLYFNLGNARFKSGDLGRAMVNYLKAERLAPSDEDIQHNIEFARGFATVQMEGVELDPVSSFVSAIAGPYTLVAWAWWSSAAFVLLMLTLLVRFGFGLQNQLLRSMTSILIVSAVLLAGLTTWKYRSEYVDLHGVVVAESATVYTGPSTNSDVELQAAPGLVVDILGQSGDFYSVLFANKRRGWMLAKQVETI